MGRSVDRGEAGDAAALALHLLLHLEQLVEGHEQHPVAALVQAVVVEARHLYPEGTALGVGAHHRQGQFGVYGGVEA